MNDPPCLLLALALVLVLAGGGAARPLRAGDDEPPLCADCVAGTLRCGEPARGALEAGDCDFGDATFADVYRLEVLWPQEVSLRLRSEEFDAYLVLTDAACDLDDPVAWSNDCDPGQSRDACFTLDLSPGIYYAIANSVDPGEVGSYTLEARCEGGGLCEHCVLASPGCGESIGGTLGQGDCVFGDGTYLDVYRLDLPEPRRVTLRLFSEEFDPFLTVEDAICAAGDPVAINDDCAPEERHSCLTLDLAAGTYYVFANSLLPGEGGEYRLDIECAPTTPCAQCGAGFVLCGDSIRSTLGPGDCGLGEGGSYIDAHRLDLDAPQRVTVRLRSEEFDTLLILEDPVCTGPEAIARSDDCAPGVEDSCITAELEEGTYFLLVTSAVARHRGEYTLDVICGVEPEACDNGRDDDEDGFADCDDPDCAAEPICLGRLFVRGDVDGSGRIDITDWIYLLTSLFLSGPAPACFDAADADDSGSLSITDAIYGLSYGFRGGPAPLPPTPSDGAWAADGRDECGQDVSPDALDCASFPLCDSPPKTPGPRGGVKKPWSRSGRRS